MRAACAESLLTRVRVRCAPRTSLMCLAVLSAQPLGESTTIPVCPVPVCMCVAVFCRAPRSPCLLLRWLCSQMLVTYSPCIGALVPLAPRGSGRCGVWLSVRPLTRPLPAAR